MTADPASLVLAFLAGMAFGGAYMAALWSSVRRLGRARTPALALLGGAVLRLALVMAAFYLVMDGSWERLLACLAGFVVVRVAVTRWARPAEGD
jgi:F1F0 ATPase subunit 2